MTSSTYPLVEQWVSDMRAVRRSERTVSERRRVVVEVATAAGVAPEALTAAQIRAWLAGKGGLKPASISTFLGALRGWFKWLQRRDLRQDDPTARLEPVRLPPAVPRPLTDSQVAHLLACAHRARMRAYLVLGAYQGLRVHEISAVRGEHVDRLAGLLHVKGKGGVVAELPLHPYTLEVADKFPSVGLWFPSYDDPARAVLPNSVSNAMSKFMAANGVNGTAHQLRHWHATAMLQHGTDIRVVQTMMRHASIATTQRYAAVNRPQQVAAMSALPLLQPTP